MYILTILTLIQFGFIVGMTVMFSNLKKWAAKRDEYYNSKISGISEFTDFVEKTGKVMDDVTKLINKKNNLK